MTLVGSSGVPAGTPAQIVRADDDTGRPTVGAAWERSPDDTLIDWFTRAERERYLALVPEVGPA